MTVGSSGWSRARAPMTPSRAVVWLGTAIVALALVAGLLWPGGPGSSTFTTVRGVTVGLFGHGVYANDSVFAGAGYRGTDLVTVALAVPILIVSLLSYRRGSLRGGLVLAGVLAYILYVYASLSLNAAYNSLFLVYVALFSLSLWTIAQLLASLDLSHMLGDQAISLPRRFPGILLIVAGAMTLLVWLSPLVTALLQGGVPARLDSYSTAVTSALDLALIVPACFVSGILMLRRVPLGYLLACPLLGIIILLGPGFVTQTLWQLSAGVTFTVGEAVGPIAGFGVVAVVALVVLVTVLRMGPGAAGAPRHPSGGHNRAYASKHVSASRPG